MGVGGRAEVLAPVGDRDTLDAAIAAGADAVYFGLAGFNARARAHNAGPGDLPDVLRTLHRHGRRGYVALNTLVFDHEWDQLRGGIEACARAGADAVIVQDLGVAELCREVAPQL